MQKMKKEIKKVKKSKLQSMHTNTVADTISCVQVQDMGKRMKKDSKKEKKVWKKVLTKGKRDGIIVKLSRETAVTNSGKRVSEKLF